MSPRGAIIADSHYVQLRTRILSRQMSMGNHVRVKTKNPVGLGILPTRLNPRAVSSGSAALSQTYLLHGAGRAAKVWLGYVRANTRLFVLI